MRTPKYLGVETSKGMHVNLVAGNGRVIGTSAKNGITVPQANEVVIQAQTCGTDPSKYEKFTGKDGKHYFNLRDQYDGVSFRSEGYTEKNQREAAIKRFMEASQTTRVIFKPLKK